MGQMLHGSARTMERTSSDTISQERLKVLAKRHGGINPKTAARWKKRGFVHDAPLRSKEEVAWTVLTKGRRGPMCASVSIHSCL